jgi:hypothetical protein
MAWLRRESGDVWLRPYRLTPERYAAYAAAVRAVVHGGAAVDADDPGELLDADRQPLLRPWALSESYPGADGRTGPDLARALAERLATRPALADTIRAHVGLEEFAAAHLKLLVGVRALLRGFGTLAEALTADDVRRWAATQRPRDDAQADFLASLVTAASATASAGVLDGA